MTMRTLKKKAPAARRGSRAQPKRIGGETSLDHAAHTKDEPHLGKDRRSLVVFLWRAVRWMDDGLQQTLQERGLFSTTRTQSLVIGNLSNGENRPSRLARIIGISPQAMSQVIGDLVEVGLVHVGKDEKDGRARVVLLTSAGEQYLATVRPIFHELEMHLEERFGRPVLDVVRMVLEQDWGPTITIDPDE